MEIREDTGEYIFVFGSNLKGIHGKGAAKVAREHFGAEMRNPEGKQGNSYAIPTKETPDISLGIDDIRRNIAKFVKYTQVATSMFKGLDKRKFFVTRVGCGLAGFKDVEIAPMFRGAVNCVFPEGWEDIMKKADVLDDRREVMVAYGGLITADLFHKLEKLQLKLDSECATNSDVNTISFENHIMMVLVGRGMLQLAKEIGKEKPSDLLNTSISILLLVYNRWLLDDFIVDPTKLEWVDDLVTGQVAPPEKMMKIAKSTAKILTKEIATSATHLDDGTPFIECIINLASIMNTFSRSSYKPMIFALSAMFSPLRVGQTSNFITIKITTLGDFINYTEVLKMLGDWVECAHSDISDRINLPAKAIEFTKSKFSSDRFSVA